MITTQKKRLLIVCRRPPYGSSLAREALDVVLAAAVFEQSLAVLFTDDGVWQLIDKQDTSLIACKNHNKLLAILPMYDINQLYINGDAMKQRHIDAKQLILPAQALHKDKIGDFIAGFDSVLSF